MGIGTKGTKERKKTKEGPRTSTATMCDQLKDLLLPSLGNCSKPNKIQLAYLDDLARAQRGEVTSPSHTADEWLSPTLQHALVPMELAVSMGM